MRRVQVLNQHKGHAGVYWEVLEKVREGFQAPRRGADADDWEWQSTRFRPTGRGLRLGSELPLSGA